MYTLENNSKTYQKQTLWELYACDILWDYTSGDVVLTQPDNTQTTFDSLDGFKTYVEENA